MPRTYRNPPLIEAVCEFRFTSQQDWDWTIPGLIYPRIRDQFPIKRQQKLVEFHAVASGPDQVSQVGGPVDRLQFHSEDESAIVQLGPNLLAVNQLRPYRNWTAFKKLITEQLGIYVETVVPDAISRIGLRYIDRVELPSAAPDVEQYLQAFLRLPQVTPQQVNSFTVRAEIPYADPPAVMRYVLATADGQPSDKVVIILDIDLFSGGDDAPSIDDVPAWAETSHDRIEAAFDGTFTERTHRELFGGGE